MARMHPTRPDHETPMSERKVFECLAQNLPSDWVVFYARRFLVPAASGGRLHEGEMDFLVIDPERGMLGLEVKGGVEVGRDQDGWFSRSHLGHIHRIKDPGKQAQQASQ